MINKIFLPSYISKFTDKYLKYIIIAMLAFLTAGIYYGFFESPVDYQQGEYVRIMYVHVPSAWMSLGIYTLMAIASFVYLVWNNPVFDLISKSSAPIGTVFCFITLYTGSFWGKPIWGTWWVWDARLTSMLILFFFYIGYLVLSNLTEDKRNNKAPAALAILGIINVPIVKFSVNLWNSLHQPASVFKLSGPSIHISMLIPLMLMFMAFILYFKANLLIILKRKFIEYKITRKDIN
ncbi:MAG: heme ABC transporter permease [Rickettsiales bacterium]|jgi:heme exporter protein C|nr:heme ABC transporter permease [Rickettsiales bacterium]